MVYIPDGVSTSGVIVTAKVLIRPTGHQNMTVDCSSGGSAALFYQYIADETGRTRYAYTANPDAMAAAIVAEINAATSAPIETLTVTVRGPEYAGWVTVTPPYSYGHLSILRFYRKMVCSNIL